MKLNSLLKSGHFNSPEVDEKGYGTFFTQKPKESSKESPNKVSSHSYLEQAKICKREADILNKQNSKKAIILYIQSVFYYIKGYSKNNLIQWKGLYNYVKELERMTNNQEILNFIKNIKFNIKFHNLSLENQNDLLHKDIVVLYANYNSLKKVKKLEELEEDFIKLKEKYF
ncbi:hypothetical protein NBO_941g0004 [Nosema bombycis CQ1]|uniref:Uncharacterized protein n=1 Tax=Nosema bombycis (strain CQ1 / CVCC 102059) TaxID=578461 RepID=R0KND9_NOSB1|nr:hypothetical protein NBO_941g0004 [Nosema bombycis CQ1]|eukprot:EOB11672.1 hypothetical protein NBO_941g0004 [Nosema bombycis CQ1]